MSLLGSRLQTAVQAATLAQIQTNFPIPAGLQPAEIALLTSYQTLIANAIAVGDATPTVSEITANAVVNPNTLAVVPSAMSNSGGPLTGNGSVSAGTGTVT